VNQRVLRKQLQNVGFEVHVANHGGEALEKIQQSNFWKKPVPSEKRINISVVLMDWEMPVSNYSQP
jgi:CheY-like chemotaxis protein